MNKAAHAYFKTNVSTTDQGHLLIMLYDGALKFCSGRARRYWLRTMPPKAF